jgi:hypothetical protein
MVKLIAGHFGTGKTKRIIQMANETLEKTTGNIIFIDDDKRHMYELKHDLRFISMDEYPVNTKDEFIGFLCGVLSNNYDIEYIFIDSLFKVIKMEMSELEDFMMKVEKISKTFDVHFNMTVSCDNLPESLKGYLME